MVCSRVTFTFTCCSFQILMTDFQKIYTKCHENPSSGSRVVPRGQTDGQTDMTKPTVVFRKFANAPKKTCTTQQKSRLRKKINSVIFIFVYKPCIFIVYYLTQFTSDQHTRHTKTWLLNCICSRYHILSTAHILS